MPEQEEIKKALENLVGHELSEEALQRLQLFERVAIWDRTDQPGLGFVTLRNILMNRKFCPKQPLLDVSGSGTTDSAGQLKLRLTDFICLTRITVETPINLLATPVWEKPVFVTVLQSLVLGPSGTFGVDVNMTFFTWGPGGTRAGNIPFNWRCRVGFQESPNG